MQNKDNRRSFLGKLLAGTGALLSFPILGKTGITQVDPGANKVVKKVKPLGFQWETEDPFLFCVHHEDHFPKGDSEMAPVANLEGRDLGNDFIIKDGFRMYHGKKVPGFPGHPHRGFETITVVRKGMVDHADSMGAAGRYGDGDVQWMTAGGGVQHAEMFPLLSQENDNPLELFQIWLNLPAKNKLVPPHFKMLWREDIPIYTEGSGNAKVVVEVIAGTLKGLSAVAPPPDSWAADPENSVSIFNIKMNPNTSFTLPKVADGVKTTLYHYIGEQLVVSGTTIPKYHRASLASGHKHTLNSGNHESRILILQGRPIKETVIQYGPFVMNSKQEIQQAFDDFHRTKFGGWPWPKYDQVHNRYAGRFAQHADGTREVKK